MRVTFFLAILCLSINAMGQTLKTFNGPLADGKLQNGIAVYNYFENPETHDYVKQGVFKYTFNGKSEYKGYNQTIKGSFEKGLKNGKWEYIIKMDDFGKDNPYYTGSVSLVANYKNGYADGNWKEVQSYKERKKYFSNGQYKWGEFEPTKTMTITMNFKDGKLIGAVSINDEFSNYKVTGSFDNSGLCVGTWMINDVGFNKNRELIYKDNTLYEFIIRDNSDKVLEGTGKYDSSYSDLMKAKAMPANEREDAGLRIDTLCGGDACPATNGIRDYFNKLLDDDYFLYKSIGGDLSFEKGFQGGCEINAKKNNYTYTPLADKFTFKEAEDYYKKNDLLKAYPLYNGIDLNTIKPSERNVVTNKITSIKPKVGELVKSTFAENKKLWDYIKATRDFVDANFNSMTMNFKLVVDQKMLDATTNHYASPDLKVKAMEYERKYDDMKSNPCWALTDRLEACKQCFTNNRQFYTSYQMAITECYITYKDIINSEEGKGISTQYNYSIDGQNYILYNYDVAQFKNNIEQPKNNYESAISFMQNAAKCGDKYKQIEALNDQNKKKTLWNKYRSVYEDYWDKYNNYHFNLQETVETLNSLIVFSDKVITLYSKDTDDIEKQLKSIDDIEEVKRVILSN